VHGVGVRRRGARAGRRLRAAAAGPDGRRQLAAVLATAALDAARPEPGAEHGLALHRLVAGLDLAEVPAEGAEARDVDTWRDLRELRDLGRADP
jgi:CTP:molybdopterin cytidylyltransferase MocA